MTRYDIARSYDWNYEHAPEVAGGPRSRAVPGGWTFCGLPVRSPIGVPAGPLLNSRWIFYYAALGFDSLTYKTVRSSYRACYEPPNLLPVKTGELRGEGATLEAAAGELDTWAISFGMPSKAPEEWRADVERARRGLGEGQALSVSVVASPSAGWTMAQVAKDFAVCAGWAVEAGAQVVEANLSCPNVCTGEADLYLAPEAAEEIASAVRARIGDTPLALKVGLFPGPEEAEALIRAVSPYADAVSATNSIAARVHDADNEVLFGGLKRGIGGRAITRRCNEEMEMLARIVRETGSKLELIGVGGVTTARDVRDRLAAGAGHVHLATAPMLDPEVGLKIREDLAR
jgi:dihydroorotate dehydrogenase